MLNSPDGLLEPWQGYWFRAYVDCKLTVPPAPCPPAPPASVLSASQTTFEDVEAPPQPPSMMDPAPQVPALTD